MTELRIRSQFPDSLKQIIESALSERLYSIEVGIKRTEERLQEFENQYHLSTAEFIQKFNNDELTHSFDFDEWIGESRMFGSSVIAMQIINLK
ncbi:MAG: hypothetical protein GPJ29_15180 [Microcystis aeruginosa BK11-02]|jgi:deoxyribodipyrimidine photolyase-like uncharacterized protein|nr:hypothetical protein [Microcystis aeruginosa BK11-02]